MPAQYDLVAIGDIVVDEFIKLHEATVHCKVNHEECEICMSFGDKIPFEFAQLIAAVGNSANAAVAAAKLGLSSAHVTNMGDDQYGKECLATLTTAHVGTEFAHIHPGRPTNHHYVLWYEDDRTILVKHEAYPYTMPDVNDPKWIYLTSLGESSLDFHKEIDAYLQSHPSVKLAFQPGTYQMRFGTDVLKGIYQRTEVFFCNREEAARILKINEENIQALIAGLHALGPKIVVVTDGPEGAYASDGAQAWFMPKYPDPQPPYERTGAGDAFSSTFTAALALGLDVQTALKWAPINSMAVVQKVGAQAGLLTRQELEALLAKAPTDYHPRPLPLQTQTPANANS